MCGHAQSPHAVCVAYLSISGHGGIHVCGVGVSMLQVTFDLYHTPLTLHLPLQILVHQLVGWMVGNMCRGGVAPCTQEVSCVIVLGVWWNGTEIIVCILVLMLSRLCCISASLLTLVDFLWLVKFFIENGCPWGSGWCCPGSSLLS